ncbi:hypothetical protein PMAYCL1PPCAC_28580, partial [Pristionchus mayeri]
KCLSPHHTFTQCDRKCKQCTKPHHNTLCDSHSTRPTQSGVNAAVTSDQPANGVARLYTASVSLQNPMTNRTATRHVFLDTGGMVSSMHLQPLSAEDYTVVKAHCGDVPHFTQSSIVTPDLLISITDTQDLLVDSKITNLPSGYRLTQSILGPMITGKSKLMVHSTPVESILTSLITDEWPDDPIPPTAHPPYAQIAEPIQSPLINLKRCSTLNKAVNITGFVLRFIQRSLTKSSNSSLKEKYTQFPIMNTRLLTALERSRALQTLIRNHQSCHIHTHDVWIKNNIISQDETEIWRANSRLDHADIPAETKSPILIPTNKDSTLARLIISHTHVTMFHAGTENVLNQLKNHYWIPRSRQVVKSEVRSCIPCRKTNNLPYAYTSTPPLPTDRVTI